MKRSGLASLLVAALAFSACAPLSVPPGTHVFVSPGFCTSDGAFCSKSNYYWAPLREVVLAPNQGPSIILHELCHAHQHEAILRETGEEPSIELTEWYDTEEGEGFHAAVAGTASPWVDMSDGTDLEDFAKSCSLWLRDRAELVRRSPERAAWMEEHLR